EITPTKKPEMLQHPRSNRNPVMMSITSRPVFILNLVKSLKQSCKDMKNLVLKHVVYMTKLFAYAFLIQCLCMSFLLANNGNAQIKSIEEVVVEIALHEEAIENAFSKIEAVSPFSFVYTNRDISNLPRVSLEKESRSLYKTLEEIAL